jgi:hypothetical protein
VLVAVHLPRKAVTVSSVSFGLFYPCEGITVNKFIHSAYITPNMPHITPYTRQICLLAYTLRQLYTYLRTNTGTQNHCNHLRQNAAKFPYSIPNQPQILKFVNSTGYVNSCSEFGRSKKKDPFENNCTAKNGIAMATNYEHTDNHQCSLQELLKSRNSTPCLS